MHFPKQPIKAVWLLLILVLLGSKAHAENVQFLQVNLKDRSVSFALAEHPTISYTNNQLHIVTASQAVDFDVPDITDYCFATTETAIHDLKQTQDQIHKGLICFSGLPANAAVELYASDGRLALQSKASSSGQVVVDLNQLPKGVYIVRTSNQSFKVTNK